MAFNFWSLTAALTPGGRHVRLYLETEGKIRTMISEKDNFVEFHSESSPKFFTADGLLLTDLRPRDPNVTMSEAGVYALTWDNRNPSSGPGSPSDATYVSKTFGLAFSVDGLEWTVYSSEMEVQGLSGEGETSTPYPPQAGGPGQTCQTVRGGLRHVVPVFLTNDQLRLYFSYGIGGTQASGHGCLSVSGCSLGTAVSN